MADGTEEEDGACGRGPAKAWSPEWNKTGERREGKMGELLHGGRAPIMADRLH